MPGKEYSKVNIAIWADPDWRALPAAAQHLYLMLWTSPGLSYCGVHDWRPGRLAALSSGWTSEQIRHVSECLVARHFIVVDEASEEVLIRSWARHDGLFKQPKMAISFVRAYAAVASETVRKVLAYEVTKIRDADPGFTCWSDKRVSELFDHPAISAKELPVPMDPFGLDAAPRVGLPIGAGFDSRLGVGLGQTLGRVSTPVSTPPTTTTTTSTSTGRGDPSDSAASPEQKETPAEPAPPPEKKPARKRQLPDDFRPSDRHVQQAIDLGVDLRAEWPKFVDHWKANGETKADWDATLRNWIRKSPQFAGNTRPHPPAENNNWMKRTL